MTHEEHDRMQELEGLVKRYRSRIVEMKAELARVTARAERAEQALREAHICEHAGTPGECQRAALAGTAPAPAEGKE